MLNLRKKKNVTGANRGPTVDTMDNMTDGISAFRIIFRALLVSEQKSKTEEICVFLASHCMPLASKLNADAECESLAMHCTPLAAKRHTIAKSLWNNGLGNRWHMRMYNLIDRRMHSNV